jgi:hypothetical protein
VSLLLARVHCVPFLPSQADEPIAPGCKFTVVHDTVETLAQGQITELPSHHELYPYIPKPVLQGIFSQFGLLVIDGAFDLPEDKLLNNTFPNFKVRNVKDMLAVWTGKA